MITLTSLLILTISSISLANDNELVFVAGDKSLSTKLCISLAEDDLGKSKMLFKRVYNFSYTANNWSKVKFASRDLTCNDLDMVKFTAQYHSGETFKYINNHAAAKYRLSEDEIKIIDLAREQRLLDPKEEIIASR